MSPDADGYANGRDRAAMGASMERPPEVFQHWHRDNNQEFVIPFTRIEKQVGLWVPRHGDEQTPSPIRLVRLLDRLEEGE